MSIPDYKTQDLLPDCLADWKQKTQKVGNPPSTDQFKELFCRACRNPVCVNHQAGDPFAARMSNQADRLMNPSQADPNQPKYARIVQADFANLLNQAVKLEISSKRNDWTPVETPSFDITDGKPVSNESKAVDAAVQRLAEAQGRKAPEKGESPERDPLLWERAVVLAQRQQKSHIEEYVQAIYDRLESSEPDPEEPEEAEPVIKGPPAPQHPKAPLKAPPPPRGNATAQGGMIGSLPEPQPAADPWAVPVDPRRSGGRRVKAGVRIKLTASGEIDD
jgi:hypothetical protein